MPCLMVYSRSILKISEIGKIDLPKMSENFYIFCSFFFSKRRLPGSNWLRFGINPRPNTFLLIFRMTFYLGQIVISMSKIGHFDVNVRLLFLRSDVKVPVFIRSELLHSSKISQVYICGPIFIYQLTMVSKNILKMEILIFLLQQVVLL